MNLIESALSQRLLAKLFDDTIVPLEESRRAGGEPTYLSMEREEHSNSYFSQPFSTSMEVAEFDASAYGTSELLIDGLAAHWENSGNTDLCSLIPMMREIASALQEEAVENDGSVSVFCYAMF